ncbi:hypothetical protein CUC08_Gglean005996 [Alternaria sp. MG1]|nr:hypothetical protein CUC08_Gglean005996 [Alternaria sp. MG1]
MRCLLALLAIRAIFGLAETCDPQAYEDGNPYGLEETNDPNVMSKLNEYLVDNLCIKYSDGTEQNIKEQCKDVCIPSQSASEGQAVVSSHSCIFGDNPWYDTSNMTPLLCGADEAFKEFAGEFFIEGLIEAGKILEKVICPALKALDVVVAIGMAAIPPPGHVITGGMVAAVRSAKAYKYAHEAQDAAQEWADFFLSGANFAEQAGCGPLIPTKNNLIKKAFTPLVDAPDELVPGGMNYEDLPCPKRGCKGCKGPKCTNGSGNEGGDASKTNIQPAPTTGSTVPPQVTTIVSKTSSGSLLSTAAVSSIISSSSSMSSIATPSLSCQDLATLDRDEEIVEPEVLRRSYPIDLTYHRLYKREPKKGKPCEQSLNSFNYPSTSEWGDHPPTRYGFNKRNSCDDYSFDNPDDDGSVDYQTEHVLEWQTVWRFFDEMDGLITTKFSHPQPGNTAKLSFCEYWTESWLSTPDAAATSDPAATPGPQTKKLPPRGWLASQYTYRQSGKEMWLDEMTLLESNLNGRVKGILFNQKRTKNGLYIQIRDKKKMKELIEGRTKEKDLKNLNLSPGDQTRVAIQRLRETIGALKYMQDKKISKIFVDQKNRMGAMIGHIDRELHKTPRVYKGDVEGHPWQEQKLEEKWNAYMDNVFSVAKQRATDYMKLNIGVLKDEWNSDKKKNEFKADSNDDQAKKDKKKGLKKTQEETLALIKKLSDEWDKVNDWQKPENW